MDNLQELSVYLESETQVGEQEGVRAGRERTVDKPDAGDRDGGGNA